jgi:hypothetical protein
MSINLAVALHPLETLPFVRGKMDKEASFVLNRSDCYVFPFFELHKREPRRGSAILLISRSLSFAYFSLAKPQLAKT